MVLILFIILGLTFTFFLAILLVGRKIFTCPQMSSRELILLFLLRVVSSLVLAWYFKDYQFGRNDYDTYNLIGISEQEFLKISPIDFLKEMFISNYDGGYANVFGSTGSYWNDLAENIIVKGLALFNFFSHGNFYINNLLFAFIGFTGSVAFYKLFIKYFPHAKYIVITGCFLLPSILAFNSNIHKDTLCFALLGIYFLSVENIFQQGSRPRYLAIAFFSLAGLFLFRNYIAAVLFPLTIVAYLIWYKDLKPLKSFTFSILVIISILLLMQIVNPGKSVLTVIANKQHSYMQHINDNTRLNVVRLKPDIKSFSQMLPAATLNGFFRPFPADNKPVTLIPFFFELYTILVMALLLLIQRKKIPPKPILLLGIFFSLSMFIIIGYSIPNLASIIRYKSIYLPLIFVPIAATLLKRPTY